MRTILRPIRATGTSTARLTETLVCAVLLMLSAGARESLDPRQPAEESSQDHLHDPNTHLRRLNTFTHTFPAGTESSSPDSRWWQQQQWEGEHRKLNIFRHSNASLVNRTWIVLLNSNCTAPIQSVLKQKVLRVYNALFVLIVRGISPTTLRWLLRNPDVVRIEEVRAKCMCVTT
jgi:hypothetical protein